MLLLVWINMPAIKQLFNDFSLGQIDKANPELIPNNALQRAYNVDVDTEGQLGTRLGVRRLNTGLNVLTHPSAFDDVAWTKTNITVTADQKPNPYDGTADADKIEDTSAFATASIESAKFDALNYDDIWTASVWVRTPFDPLSGGGPDIYPAVMLAVVFYAGAVQKDFASVLFGLHPDDPDNKWYIPTDPTYIGAEVIDYHVSGPITASDGALWYNLVVTGKGSDLTNDSVSLVIWPCGAGYQWNPSAPIHLGFIDPPAGWLYTGFIYTWGAKLYPGSYIEENELLDRDSAPWDLVAPTTDVMQQLGKVTSIFEYTKTDGTSEIITTFERTDPSVVSASPAAYQEVHYYDEATNLFDIVPPATPASQATGNGHRWQWVNFNDLAIGVNRVSTAENAGIGAYNIFNPVKKTAFGDTTGFVAALAGSPPRGRYIEVFKSRVWIVDEDNPDTLVCSALNNEEDYTTTGIAGSQSFQFYDAGGSTIMGIKAGKTPDGRDVLFVFLKSSVYYVLPGSPDVDIAQYNIKLLSSATGCVSAYTIAEILDDTVFLSPYGVLPISALFTSKDLENSALSKSIFDFDNLNLNTEEHVATVDIRNSKYIISISTGVNTKPNKCWVFDFTRVKEGIIAAFEYGGAWIANAYGIVSDPVTGEKRIVIGSYADDELDDVAAVYLGNEDGRYHDSFASIDTVVITKRFTIADFAGLLDFKRLYAAFRLLTATANIIVSVRFDSTANNSANYQANFSGTLFSGGVWGTGIWDSSKWAVPLDTIRRWQKKLIATLTNNLNTRARTIEITISTSEEISAYLIQALGFKANQLGDYRW